MRRIWTKILVIIGGITVVLFFMALAGAALGSFFGKRVARRTVLEINFEAPLAEYVPATPLARLMHGRTPTVLDMVGALTKASSDPRVVGLVANVGTVSMGWAQIQELRDAIRLFRDSGKRAVAFAQTFGEFGPGNGSYYLATAFDEIYLQPSGDLGLTGLISQTPFLKGTMEKLALKPRLANREEYKSAPYLLTQRDYIPPHEEENRAIIESIFSDVVDGIVQGRGIVRDSIAAMIDHGPFSGSRAVQLKLIDGLAYRDEVIDTIWQGWGKRPSFLRIMEYLDRAGSPYDKGPVIALIYGVGTIARGSSGYTALTGEHVMGSETVSAAFRAAARDRSTTAIVFRINSPGGSYVASDAIWREVGRVRAAGKPVIVSMSDVAGSGGYYVAMPADAIVAHPATITGSIGVVAGKIVVDEFWAKLGVTWDEVHTSENAAVWTAVQDYSPRQWDRFQGWLDRVYDDFVTKAAQGRRLSKERARSLAGGRIWSGRRALELGLIDSIGGFPLALRMAKRSAGIADDRSVTLKVFPPRKSIFEILAAREDDRDGGSTQETSRLLNDLRLHVRVLWPWLMPVASRVLSVDHPPIIR